MKMKRTAMIAGLLGLAAVLAGCGGSGSPHEDTVSYDVTDKVAALHVETDSGAIETSGLTGKQVSTETDSGDMTLAFTGRPDKVTTSTDSGKIVIHVPQGPYDIVTSTDSGNQDIKAASDSSADSSIELSSDSGDLEVATP